MVLTPSIWSLVSAQLRVLIKGGIDQVNSYTESHKVEAAPGAPAQATNLNLSQLAFEGNTYQGKLTSTNHNPSALASSPYPRKQHQLSLPGNRRLLVSPPCPQLPLLLFCKTHSCPRAFWGGVPLVPLLLKLCTPLNEEPQTFYLKTEYK